MKISWFTDLHLNFLNNPNQGIQILSKRVTEEKSEAVIITGDIGEADSVGNFLEGLSFLINLPIYFVLGNHDFYQGWIKSVRQSVSSLGSELNSKKYLSNLRYLTTENDPIEISPDTCLIGHDGWADARAGDFRKSSIRMNDHVLINDFINLTENQLLEKLNQLGNEAAEHIRRMLTASLEKYSNVILATHVPPFEECCNGGAENESYENWLPHAVCKSVGEVIIEVMSKSPNKNLTVYCGHTHKKFTYMPLPNVQVYVGSPSI